MIHETQPIIDLNVGLMRRGDQDILSRVRWRILPGEHWALLGANGSGKSSLLKIITGYEWPTEGMITVLGERFGQVDLRRLRKSIGLVSSALVNWFPPDQDALSVAVSGLEASIGLWREFTTEEFDLGRAAMREIGAAAFMGKPYGVLSQGERQRVMIARALVHRPALLILDEPCAGLDPCARETFLRDLDVFVGQPGSPTIIFVTHHIEEIAPFITHGLALKDGMELAKGPISEVFNSEVLGRAFGFECSVEKIAGRYQLRITGIPTHPASL